MTMTTQFAAHVSQGTASASTSTVGAQDASGNYYTTTDGNLFHALSRNMGSPSPGYVYVLRCSNGYLEELPGSMTVTLVRAVSITATT